MLGAGTCPCETAAAPYQSQNFPCEASSGLTKAQRAEAAMSEQQLALLQDAHTEMATRVQAPWATSRPALRTQTTKAPDLVNQSHAADAVTHAGSAHAAVANACDAIVASAELQQKASPLHAAGADGNRMPPEQPTTDPYQRCKHDSLSKKRPCPFQNCS